MNGFIHQKKQNMHTVASFLVCTGIVLLFLLLYANAAREPFRLGDVDGNSKVESADARLALRASVQLESFEQDSAPFLAADIDKNGIIQSSDARIILRATVGLEQLEEKWNTVKKFAPYKPEKEQWSVWDDMPDNSVYNGTPEPFKNSVDANIVWNNDAEYQLLKINGFVYLSSPGTEHFYVGQKTTSGEQKWISPFQEVLENTYQTNHYENTYILNCEPVITTDSNCYLASPGDNSDMTGSIQAMLKMKKVCQLGPGDFYVSGITIPAYGLLRGCGTATRLILLDSVETGYAVQLLSYSCITDMRIVGATSAIKPTDPIGERHGILFEGLADSEGSVPYSATVEDVTVTDFSGGAITCYNTGYSCQSCLNVSNCYLVRCGAGINIPYFSEYNRFTNVSATGCYYGCINNGGNNMFSNCGFNGNTVGLLMDNNNSKSPNSSHGSFVGCTFNHSENNEGYAIKIIGMKNGETFNGCQIFFGKTFISDCQGIQFIGSNMGKKTGIEITDSSAIIFSNCIIRDPKDTPVSVQNSASVRFVDCYCRNGEEFLK